MTAGEILANNLGLKIRGFLRALKNLEKALQKKGIISQAELSHKDEVIWDWPEEIPMLADEQLLAEDWLSPEDEEAWKDL